tara:strand:- start:228 stop:419 length:192 start_codon:yes stop_codon:yes gene_type:complete
MPGTKKKLFFDAVHVDVLKNNWPNTGKSSSDGRARHRNDSGVVNLVGREPLMFAKVEKGVTKQ